MTELLHPRSLHEIPGMVGNQDDRPSQEKLTEDKAINEIYIVERDRLN